jgi:hypothetical protein
MTHIFFFFLLLELMQLFLLFALALGFAEGA